MCRLQCGSSLLATPIAFFPDTQPAYKARVLTVVMCVHMYGQQEVVLS